MSGVHRAGNPEPREYLVYICGIHVPCESVDVAYGVWTPPTCDLVLPPSPILRRMGQGDLVPVQVFYLDIHGRRAQGKAPEWCLLFDGMIVSQNYTNSGQGRGISFHCIDMVITMQMLRIYFLMNVSNMVQAETNVDGAGAFAAHSEFVFPASLFYYGLDPVAGGPIRRPYDFVENMFRSLVGARDEIKALERLIAEYTDASKTRGATESTGDEKTDEAVADAVKKADEGAEVTKGVEGAAAARAVAKASEAKFTKSAAALHWWGRWAERTAFLENWLPWPGIEDNDNGLDGAFPVLQAVQSDEAIKAVKRLGSALGDGATLWDLLKDIFTRMLYEVLIVPAPAAVATNPKTGRVLGPVGAKGHGVIAHYVTKPKAPFALPPMCNVIWPSMTTQLSYNEGYLGQPTRMLLSDGNLFNLVGAPAGPQDLQDFYNFALATAHPEEAQKQLDRHLGRGGTEPDPLASAHNYLVYPDEFYRGPVSIKGPLPSWFVYMKNAQPPGLAAEGVSELVGFKARATAHLSEQAKDAASGDERARIEKILEQVQKLPVDAKDAPEGTTDAEISAAWMQTAHILSKSDRELQGMSGAAAMSKKFRSVAAMGIGDEKARRLFAAQEFALAKYKHRAGAVMSVFHPYVVPGLSGVFWDNESSAHHVFGSVMNVAHHMDANSASTSINFSMGRTFAEVEDLLKQSGGGVSIAPANPIEIVARVMQTKAGAHDSFTKLFWRGQARKSKRQTVFILREMTRVWLRGTAKELVPLKEAIHRGKQGGASAGSAFVPESIGSALADASRQVEAENAKKELKKTRGLLRPQDLKFGFDDEDVDFYPAPGRYARISDDVEQSRQESSRPVCTLPEWIAMHRGYGTKVRVVMPGTPASDSRSARYWVRILALKPGPGVKPASTPLGNLLESTGADTRRDWQKRLIKYRDQYFTRKAGRLA